MKATIGKATAVQRACCVHTRPPLGHRLEVARELRRGGQLAKLLGLPSAQKGRLCSAARPGALGRYSVGSKSLGCTLLNSPLWSAALGAHFGFPPHKQGLAGLSADTLDVRFNGVEAADILVHNWCLNRNTCVMVRTIHAKE